MIAARLCYRATSGLRTTILKVKAHTGIAGNERADTLANEAHDPALCDTSMNQCNSAHAAHYWPMYTKSLPDASLAPDKFAADLCASLKHHVSSSCAGGFANPSQYEDYWQAIMPHLHKISFSFWTSLGLSEAIRCQVILARFGQTWNMNQAWKQGRPYKPGMQVPRFPGCPLCKHVDSIGHMLGDCSHCIIKSIIIERHNHAGRLILGALHRGSLGNCYTIADIGSQEKMAGMQQHDTRIPDFMLADIDLPEGPSQLRKLRPDIMITDVTPGETLSCKPSRKRGRHGGQHNHHITTTANGRARRVWIVEVGYCSDTRYLDKLQEKTLQHRQLQSLLMDKGFKVTCLPIILGNSGAIYSTTESSLLQLGISHKAAQSLMLKLSDHAARYLHKLIKTRRLLEHPGSLVYVLEPPDPP